MSVSCGHHTDNRGLLSSPERTCAGIGRSINGRWSGGGKGHESAAPVRRANVLVLTYDTGYQRADLNSTDRAGGVVGDRRMRR